MTRTILAQYIDACAVLEDTADKLVKARERASALAVDSVKGSNPNFPYEPMVFKVEGIGYGVHQNPAEVQELERILKERIATTKALKLQVEAWVNTVPPRIQRIVQMKYFEGLTWSQISQRLGYYSADATRKELMRFLAIEETKNNAENEEKSDNAC